MKRIVAIDLLRGFALLGILLMNIMSFSMPDIAYSNPYAYGGEAWYNQLTYSFTHIFAEQKFMGLFSLLFGASVILLLDKLESRGEKPARFHYTRNIWLLLFGLIHTTFIWAGDVLTLYALCSFVLFFMRKLSIRWKLILGLFIFLSPTILYLLFGYQVGQMPPEEVSGLIAYWQPDQATLDADIDHFLSDYVTIYFGESNSVSGQAGLALDLSDTLFFYDFAARAFGAMLIGMGLFSSGVLTAQKSNQFYRRMLVIGFGIGIPLAIVGLVLNYANEWSALFTPFYGQIPNTWATPFVVAGYIGLVMLWSRSRLWAGIQNRLVAVGRTALTNYIGQSIIAVLIFYGYGLGLFGTVNRVTQLLFVLGIWLFQLMLAPIWMDHFRYGPLEWLWRSLSHWKMQPFRRLPQPAGD